MPYKSDHSTGAQLCPTFKQPMFKDEMIHHYPSFPLQQETPAPLSALCIAARKIMDISCLTCPCLLQPTHVFSPQSLCIIRVHSLYGGKHAHIFFLLLEYQLCNTLQKVVTSEFSTLFCKFHIGVKWDCSVLWPVLAPEFSCRRHPFKENMPQPACTVH